MAMRRRMRESAGGAHGPCEKSVLQARNAYSSVTSIAVTSA
jgi:hypothetical protein